MAEIKSNEDIKLSKNGKIRFQYDRNKIIVSGANVIITDENIIITDENGDARILIGYQLDGF